jgi:hypothetical protein
MAREKTYREKMWLIKEKNGNEDGINKTRNRQKEAILGTADKKYLEHEDKLRKIKIKSFLSTLI